MIKLIMFFLLNIYLISNTFARAVIPYSDVPSKIKDEVNDQYFNFQWSLVNFGQVLQQQRSELEYEPSCGNNFAKKEVDLDTISAEDFFLSKVDKVCTPKDSRSGYKKDFDISWVNFMTDYENRVQRDVVVAVVDSGLDYYHPDIIANIAIDQDRCNLDNRPVEMVKKKKGKNKKSNDVPPISEFDFSPDCLGWNFTETQSPFGSNLVDDDSSTSHGTHIAGILSAGVNNQIGISGLSNRIKILPVKVFRNFSESEAQIFSFESAFKRLLNQVAVGLEYLAIVKRNGRHVDAVNLSFGWPKRLTTERLNKAIQALLDLDIPVIAAAGNDDVNVDLFPCAYSGVICVGAHTNTGLMTAFTNYGSSVDMLATGDHILSLSRTDEISKLFSQSDLYDFLSGTSQAAPYVAGSAALLKAIYPGITTNEIKARLYSSSMVTKKVDDRFTLNGSLQMAEAIAQSKRPYLYPNFKQLLQLEVINKKVNIEIPISNLWKDAFDVQVKVKTKNKNISFVKTNFNYSKIKSNSIKHIAISGLINNLNKNSKLDINLIVSYMDSENHKYEQSFILSTELFIKLENANVISKPILFSQKIKDTLDEYLSSGVNGFDVGRKLTQKVFPAGVTDGPTEYYIFEPSEQNGVPGITAFLVKEGKSNFEQKKLLFLAHASRAQVFKLDLYSQNPGKEYIIRSNVEISRNTSLELKETYVEFYIISSDLKQIINILRLKSRDNLEGRDFVEAIEGESVKDYYFDFSIESLRNPTLGNIKKDMSRLYKAMATHPRLLNNPKSDMKNLFFLTEGHLSDEDNKQSINNFSQNDYLTMQLYYLEKERESNQIKIRTMSTPEFKKQLRDKYAQDFINKGIINSKVLHPDMQLYLWKLIESNSDNEVNLLVSFSMEAQIAFKGVVKKAKGINTNHFYIVTIYYDRKGQLEFDMKPLDESSGLGLSYDDSKDDILTYYALNDQLRGSYIGVKDTSFKSAVNSYIGLSGRSRFSAEKKIKVDSQDVDEFFNANGDLISFKNGETYFSFYRTSGELLLTADNGSEVTFSSNELKVTQFLPGINFEEVIVPSVYGIGDHLRPAIFVNASEIYSHRVYSWVIGGDNKSLISPIQLNIQVPEGCFTLLPSKLSSGNHFYYTFLCHDNQDWEYKFVPMKELN